MLGEIHSLVKDFPEMEETVSLLSKTDKTFEQLNGRYNQLDEEIRKLELDNAPVSDDSMHTLKHERSALKDKLYQLLLAAKQ